MTALVCYAGTPKTSHVANQPIEKRSTMPDFERVYLRILFAYRLTAPETAHVSQSEWCALSLNDLTQITV